MYTCGACGKPVIVVNGMKVRSCTHLDAPIIASANAKLEGRGGVR